MKNRSNSGNFLFCRFKSSFFFHRLGLSLLLLFIIFTNPVFSQNQDQNEKKDSKGKKLTEEELKKLRDENFEKYYEHKSDSHLAAMLGIVPGAGQLYNGNYGTGALQASIFLTSIDLTRKYVRMYDFIPDQERHVDFSIPLMLLSEELDKRGQLYRDDVAVFTETPMQRQFRMMRDKKIAEISPLLQYGPYNRYNYTTANAEMASQTALHTMFYSVYSAYRDAGGTNANPDESFMSLASAPFQPRFLFNPDVFIPLVLLAAASSGPATEPYTLVSPGMKKSGFLAYYTTVTSFNAGVGEESFFRGFMNHQLSTEYGPIYGGAISGLAFGLAHYQNGQPVATVLPQTLAGFYFAWLQQKNGYDIRPGIALHFWWDIIVIGLSLRKYKEDSNVSKGNAEVMYMPTLFQMRF